MDPRLKTCVDRVEITLGFHVTFSARVFTSVRSVSVTICWETDSGSPHHVPNSLAGMKNQQAFSNRALPSASGELIPILGMGDLKLGHYPSYTYGACAGLGITRRGDYP